MWRNGDRFASFLILKLGKEKVLRFEYVKAFAGGGFIYTFNLLISLLISLFFIISSSFCRLFASRAAGLPGSTFRVRDTAFRSLYRERIRIRSRSRFLKARRRRNLTLCSGSARRTYANRKKRRRRNFWAFS